jgi:hypothetical protein
VVRRRLTSEQAKVTEFGFDMNETRMGGENRHIETLCPGNGDGEVGHGPLQKVGVLAVQGDVEGGEPCNDATAELLEERGNVGGGVSVRHLQMLS